MTETSFSNHPGIMSFAGERVHLTFLLRKLAGPEYSFTNLG